MVHFIYTNVNLSCSCGVSLTKVNDHFHEIYQLEHLVSSLSVSEV